MKTPEVAGSGLFAGLLFHPVIKELAPGNYLVRDFTKGMDSVADLEETGYAYDVGRYNERRRAMYTTELFGEQDPWAAKESAAARDIHIGLDIGGPAGTPVHAFADGAVHSAGYNPAKGDYGHVIVTEHILGGRRVWALHGHLSSESTKHKSPGTAVAKGDIMATDMRMGVGIHTCTSSSA